MGKALVTFDITKDELNANQELYNSAEVYLNTLGVCCKPTKNVYVLDTSVSCEVIRDRLKEMFGIDCCILVCGLDGSFASYNYQQVNKILREIL